jgi:hypothetical protein
MSEQLQLRRGTELQIASFTGAQGEATPATDTMRLHIHDGATAGGWPHALESRKAVSDANYSVAITDRQVAYTAITVARTVSLPAASAYPTGAVLTIVDESGSCSATRTITLNRAGSDTINGAASAVLSQAYGFMALESNGSNAWTVVDQPGFNTISTAATATFNGQVGINTSNPGVNSSNTTKLEISGDCVHNSSYDTGQLRISGATNSHDELNIGFDTANLFGYLQATQSGIAYRNLILQPDGGNVGVGTTSPQAPLDVAGDIQTHGSHGSTIQFGLVEDTIACSGVSSVSAAQIPNRAVVLAVSVYVVTAITGATSFNVDATIASGGGAGGAAGQFGLSLGVSAGSNNVGVIGPTAWNAASTIKLTANGGNFTGGQVRISIQYILPSAPTS